MPDSSTSTLWQHCMQQMRSRTTEQVINCWLSPLLAEEQGEVLRLLAPNDIVLDWVQENLLSDIQSLVDELSHSSKQVTLSVGSRMPVNATPSSGNNAHAEAPAPNPPNAKVRYDPDPRFTFERFVQGNSNQIGLAAAQQMAENPGSSGNLLLIYGASGLGKSHLMHGVGNALRANQPEARICYVNSERFVQDMVRALQHNRMEGFKQYYRSLDLLLIDDIQFLAGKDRSQEEFFHTFNALIESHAQIVLTCDRYPKEVVGMEERLQTRLGWGMSAQISPPELETRVAILMSKAEAQGHPLTDDVAFFIAQRIPSNVRELEGALRRVTATASFKGGIIDLALTREALKDLIHVHDRKVTIDNIQKVTAEHFNISMKEMLSARRSRAIARPRQVAMWLSKRLTDNSLPDIGKQFGGRDHTTVLHAYRKINALVEEDASFQDELEMLERRISC